MSQKHKVAVSCGTKFHSDYMSYQLTKYDLLETTITAHPPSKYLNRCKLNRSKIKFLPPVFAVLYLIKKWLGNSNPVAKWIEYRMPIIYDYMASFFLKQSDVLITWAWSGLATIKKIKKRGGLAIVEECGSCNKFQNEILTEEYKQLGLSFKYNTPEYIVQRELEEVALADYVLCPSKHVANSFIQNGIKAEKCITIPYGVNLGIFKPQNIEKKDFTVMFVGTVGVRKGLIYLFKALEYLENKLPIKAIIIGKQEQGFEPIFNKYAHLFTYISRVPHHDLVDYYNQASVFVFPSLDEGMAYVQLEAMACGLPIICTPNSGGDSVVAENEEGFIVPIRDHIAIANKIEYLYNNKNVLAEMSQKAQAKALKFTWDYYGESLSKFINSI